MRLAWATDVHLDFVDGGRRSLFYASLRECCDAVLISGDIGERPNLLLLLGELAGTVAKPVYFVLGNHDFYRSSIAATREAVADLTHRSRHLVYLTAAGVVELTPATAVVGHDGWADARLGDFERSDVILNDYALIADLAHWRDDATLDKERLAEVLGVLGDEAARHFETALSEAAASYARVIAVTHVPPFREAAWYAGRTSDDNFLPHFSCRAAGEAIVRVMQRYPRCDLLVLCGHTHGSGEVRLLDNLTVLTGAAQYGAPEIQRVFEIT